MDELSRLLGKTEPSQHKCIFAVNDVGESFLISSKPNLFDIEIFEDCFLENHIQNQKFIPKEMGIYEGIIEVHSFKSNHPQDPEEWDMTITLKEFKLYASIKIHSDEDQ